MFHLLFEFDNLGFSMTHNAGTRCMGRPRRICTCSVPAGWRRRAGPLSPPVREPRDSSLSHPSQRKAGTPAFSCDVSTARPVGGTGNPRPHVDCRESKSHQQPNISLETLMQVVEQHSLSILAKNKTREESNVVIAFMLLLPLICPFSQATKNRWCSPCA